MAYTTSTSKLWRTTPLIHSRKLSDTLGASVYLKLENLQPTHSFKNRGISLFIQRVKEKHGPSVHLIIASSGNAGLAAAHTANLLQLKCSVYVPLGASQATLGVLRLENAEIVMAGHVYIEALEAAQVAVAGDANAVMVPSNDHEILWEGHSSMMDEIVAELPDKPDAIFCSVGGGGLLGGIIMGCKNVGWDDVPIIALETIGTDCFYYTMSCNGDGFNGVSKPLPPGVDAVQDEETSVTLARLSKFTSRAHLSLGAAHPAPKVVKMALKREGLVRSVSVPDELGMQTLCRFADDHRLLVELACSITLSPAYKPAFFDKLVPPKESGKKRTAVFVMCGGFRVTIDDVLEFRELVKEDVVKGGTWGVLLDDGSVFPVDK